MHDRLDSLMDSVSQAWQVAGGTPQAFTEIAEGALRDRQLHRSLSMADVLRHIATTDALPVQHDRHLMFGEPPVTLLRREGFHLDAYFWIDPSTSIHNHIFCGAFTVLEGTSLHGSYAFDVEESYAGGEILTGRVTLGKLELLRRGAVKAIDDGLDLVHRVAHLTRPTLSLVLRTSTPPPEAHAYTVLPRSLAVVGPDRLSEHHRRQLEVARMLYRTAHPLADELTAELLVRAESELQALWLLRILFFECYDLERVERLATHRASAPWVPALLEGLDGARSSLANWSLVRQEGHRLLVALTASTADGRQIRQIVEDYSGGRPAPEVVLGWIDEMTRAGLTGYHAVWSHAEPVLRCLIQGGGLDEAAVALASALGVPDASADPQVVHQVIEHLSTFPPVRPFLPSTDRRG